MSKATNKYLNRQAMKLWSVIKQFVDLDQLELINGVSGIDQKTGLPVYNWLTTGPEKGEYMRIGEYDVEIEVGSTPKTQLTDNQKKNTNIFLIFDFTWVIISIK